MTLASLYIGHLPPQLRLLFRRLSPGGNIHRNPNGINDNPAAGGSGVASLGQDVLICGASGTPPPASEERPLPGTHSSRRINALAARMRARRYLEVGVFEGETFLAVEIAERTAVDPAFRFDWEARQDAATRFHQETSDAFFGGRPAGAPPYDLIFLDGLHHFTQTFRDFTNALAASHERSLILLDDTVPSDVYSTLPGPRQAFRFRRKAGGRGLAWHGDVFKLVFLIHDFFPWLSFCTVSTGGNPQTLVWRETRAGFEPRFDSLETISRMSFFDMHRHLDLMRLLPEEEALALAGDRLAAG
jgi:hypothetical protein